MIFVKQLKWNYDHMSDCNMMQANNTWSQGKVIIIPTTHTHNYDAIGLLGLLGLSGLSGLLGLLV